MVSKTSSRSESPKVKQLRSADFEITTRCNMTCGFCFGSDPSKELSTKNAKEIIDALASSGFTSITFTGGEPFIRTDIDEILEHAYHKGFQVVLSTNGTFVQEKLEALNRYVSWLGLPLDGSCPENNDFLRAMPGHFDIMSDVFDIIRQRRLRPKIKIGTVVCRSNLGDLAEIGRILTSIPIQKWKLYQFTPRERGQINDDIFSISDSDFYSHCQRIVQAFPTISIAVSSIKDRNGAYFFIKPDGSVVTPYDDHYESLGDLAEKTPAQLWHSKHLHHISYRRNFLDTYPSDEAHTH